MKTQEQTLSKFQCGFRHGFGAQQYLLMLAKKLRKIRDQRIIFAAVLTDLSKAFDSIPHNLLIVKLGAFGSDKKSLLDFVSAYF